jgi:phage gp29-like protein
LSLIGSWPAALSHLSNAIGPNLAVVELVWSKAEIVDFVVVPSTRLVSHPFLNTGVAIRTDEEMLGIPTESLPGKFIVYIPRSCGGFPFRSTLTHASVMAFLMIHFSRADWLSFSELYGTPLRYGTYEDSIVDADRETLQDLLNEMGTDVAAMLPKGVTLDTIQASGTGETYQKQLDYADSKLAILWLGQTLTTDVGGTGSYAAAKVHDNVRGDLLASDLQAEAACVREQLLRPMVELKYPGRDAPVPIFCRKTYVGRDVEAERLTLEQLRFARESGLRIDEDVVYEKLGIPRPETAAVKTEDDAVTVPFNELTLGIKRALYTGDLDLVNALRNQIGKMIGTPMPPLTVLPDITSKGQSSDDDPDDDKDEPEPEGS